MSAVAYETDRAFELMKRIETLEDVAESLPKADNRRLRLLELVSRDIASFPPMRPRVAAELLELSEKTVRAWTLEGVFRTAPTQSSPRLLLDVERVHQVLHLVRDLRAAGKTAGLLDEVYRRLVDATWLEREDLTESLEQMRRGEGVVVVPKPLQSPVAS